MTLSDMEAGCQDMQNMWYHDCLVSSHLGSQHLKQDISDYR